MGYDVVDVNEEVLAHFEKVKHLIEHKIPSKFH
jgi:hypothetical protein